MVYANPNAINWWPREFLFQDEWDHREKLEFGKTNSLVVTAPPQKARQRFLTSAYRGDWNEVAYQIFDHQKGQNFKPVKVKVVTRTPLDATDLHAFDSPKKEAPAKANNTSDALDESESEEGE